MKKAALQLLLALTLFLQTPVLCRAASEYRVGPGDELIVSVKILGGLDDISKLSTGLPIQVLGDAVYAQHRVIVAPDGFIALPSLPPLKAAGLTLEEIRDSIVFQMRRGRSETPVSVTLAKPNSTAFFVVGEVKFPGRYVLERPTTALEALAVAGGATDRGRLRRVKILREGEPPFFVDLSYKELNTRPSFQLKANDTLVVPRRRTPDFNSVMLFLAIVSTATGVYVAAK